MYWGDYSGQHYSPLTQITPDNARQLKTAWSFPILGGNSTLEATPIVVDGVMYTTGSGNPATVTAIDARSGRQIWRWTRQQKIVNPYEINPFARGVAILGNRIFVGTLDGALVAVDARTGQTLWEQQVVDTMEGSSITSPPLVLKDMVITGMTGGEYATSGHLDAYDAATGKRKWRFYTIPAPGEPGNETWKGESWKTGGGPTWLTGSFDPALNLVYWAVGNPAPEFDRVARGEMDNLYSNSVVALDADTGTLKWHYQFTPDDGHDWDSVQDMVLVDRVWRGEQRKLLMHADRNGHFYVLDRTNGKFLSGTPFIYQNWNAGFDAERQAAAHSRNELEPEGQLPRVSDAWRRDEFPGAVLQSARRAGSTSRSVKADRCTPARRSKSRAVSSTSGAAARRVRRLRAARISRRPNAGIKAIDPETGKTIWSSSALSGIADQRRARDRRQRPLRVVARRQHPRARRARPESISGTSRPAAIIRPRR